MHMPLTLFICGRSRAADPSLSLARGPPINEDLKCKGGRLAPSWRRGPRSRFSPCFCRVTAAGSLCQCMSWDRWFGKLQRWNMCLK